MLYEALGLLLERAEAVLSGPVREHVCEPRARAQLDGVATLLGDLAAMWPELFAGVEHERQIYERALGGEPGPPAGAAPDPLRPQREAVGAMNEHIQAVHHLVGEERRMALAGLRAALLAAAEAQGAVAERAAERAADSRVRRI